MHSCYNLDMPGWRASTPTQDRLKADLLLLLTAGIWGTAFVAQRVAAVSSGVFLFNGLRFLLGALVLIPLVLLNQTKIALAGEKKKNMPGILVSGALLFTAGTFQQMGLRFTTAGNAGFITGLYVVLIPVILSIIARQRQRPAIWVAVLLASAGLFLLSTGGQFRLSPGDALELVGALFFALHVIWIGRQVQLIPILHLAIGQYLLTGLLSLSMGLILEPGAAQNISIAWLPIFYTGVFSIGIGYTLQAMGQRFAPPADAAILLSMEAPFAAIFGWLLLNELLTPIQISGCGLMLAAMLLAQISPLVKITSRQ